MATTSESTVVRLSTTSPQDWKYVSEGGATIVFSYTGSPNPEFDGMVLRLRKTTALPQSNDSSDSEINRAIQYALQGHVHQAVEELDDPMIEFQHTIMERLIPPEHLPRLAPVQVERAWLQDLANKSDPERPEERRRKDRIDILKTKAVIATDLVGGDGLAVEIKPKWAFLPSPVHLSAVTLPIKTGTCRFCMHSHFRSRGVESTPVSYCPLDLFSGDEVRIKKAVQSLWDGWLNSGGSANNLRVFVHGKMVKPTDQFSFNLLKEDLAVDGDNPDQLSANFISSIVPLLVETPVLRTLAKLQRSLDVLDIEGLSKLWSLSLKQSTSEVSSVIEATAEQLPLIGSTSPEPSIADWTEFVDEYLTSHKSLDHSDPKLSNLRYYLLAYLLSATFKDCSIMLRTHQHKDSSSPEGVKGTVTVIDLDPKSIGRLSKWEKLDREIVESYTGMEARKCVDGWKD